MIFSANLLYHYISITYTCVNSNQFKCKNQCIYRYVWYTKGNFKWKKKNCVSTATWCNVELSNILRIFIANSLQGPFCRKTSRTKYKISKISKKKSLCLKIPSLRKQSDFLTRCNPNIDHLPLVDGYFN